MDNLVFGWTWSTVNTARKKEKQNFKAPVFFLEKFLFRPFSARFFAEKVPVFRPFFPKNEPVWRILHTDIPKKHLIF